MKFDSYHPIINFIYFIVAAMCIIEFDHPVYMGVACIVIFAYYFKLKGKKAIKNSLILTLGVVGYTLIYASYNHFGVTVLFKNRIGNNITLESILFGFCVGVRIAVIIMLFGCMFAIISSDKVIYIFGRISPKLSLYIAIMLRSIPRIKQRGEKIDLGRKGIGKSYSQGSIIARMKNGMAHISSVISITIEDFIDSSNSMKARGYSLKGRTSFSLYEIDNRDRGFIITMCFFIIIIWGAWILGYTNIYYDPKIVISGYGATDILFCLIYGLLLGMPLISEIIYEKRFKQGIDIC